MVGQFTSADELWALPVRYTWLGLSSYSKYSSLLPLIRHPQRILLRTRCSEILMFCFPTLVHGPCLTIVTQDRSNQSLMYCELYLPVWIFISFFRICSTRSTVLLIIMIHMLISSIMVLFFMRVVPKYTRLSICSKLQSFSVVFCLQFFWLRLFLRQFPVRVFFAL